MAMLIVAEVTRLCGPDHFPGIDQSGVLLHADLVLKLGFVSAGQEVSQRDFHNIRPEGQVILPRPRGALTGRIDHRLIRRPEAA